MFSITHSKKLYLIAQLKFWGIFCTLILFLFLDIKYGIGKVNITFRILELFFAFLFGFIFYPVFSLVLKKTDKIADKLLDDADAARRGFEGENTVAGWLKQLLPQDSYRVLRNVKLSGHKFDIDFIVIGPKGVIMLEVKNFTEQRCFSEDEYFQVKNSRKHVLPLKDDPREEVRYHLYYLRKQFESKMPDRVRISKAVVFLNENDVIFEGNPGIYIANGFDSLKRFIEGVSEDSKYDDSFYRKIENILGNKA